jgi:exonuclease III
VTQENLSLLSLQETKLSNCGSQLLSEICGPSFDFFHKPAVNTSGGILVAWKTDTWSVSNPLVHANNITVRVTLLRNDEQWWLTSVYGPQQDQDKVRFLDELRQVRASCPGSWVVCGDFNMIYRAED